MLVRFQIIIEAVLSSSNTTPVQSAKSKLTFRSNVTSNNINQVASKSYTNDRSNIILRTWTENCNFFNKVQILRKFLETPYTLSGQNIVRTSKPQFSRRCGMPHPIMAAVTTAQPRWKDFCKLINRHATHRKYLATRMSSQMNTDVGV